MADAEPRRGARAVVLASGGLDSSTLMAFAQDTPASLEALFIDYGQLAAEAERRAVSAVTSALGVQVRTICYRGSEFGAGEIRARNAFLLQVALMEFPGASGTVMCGIHAGTGYRDCTPEFVDLMRDSFDFHTGGAISVAAPFVTWTKLEILKLARSLSVPIEHTYSCEAGNTACSQCASCLERRAVLLRERQ